MNTNIRELFINTIRVLKENFFIIPLFICFFAFTEYYIFRLNSFEGFFGEYISSFFNNLNRNVIPEYSIALIIFYLLFVILLYTFLVTYLLNRKTNIKTNLNEIIKNVNSSVSVK